MEQIHVSKLRLVLKLRQIKKKSAWETWNMDDLQPETGITVYFKSDMKRLELIHVALILRSLNPQLNPKPEKSDLNDLAATPANTK